VSAGNASIFDLFAANLLRLSSKLMIQR
jgi:hypothetical protein